MQQRAIRIIGGSEDGKLELYTRFEDGATYAESVDSVPPGVEIVEVDGSDY